MTSKRVMVIGALVLVAALLGVFLATGPFAEGPNGAPPPVVTESGGGILEPGAVPGETGDPAARAEDADLHGIVVDPRGDPVSGVRLEARRPAPGFAQNVEDILSPEVLATGTSAADGSFSLALAGATTVDLVASGPDGTAAVLPLCSPDRAVRVVLVPGARVEVVVRDEAASPVPDVDVFLVHGPLPGHPVLACRGTTDGNGRIVFEGVAPGRVMPGFFHDRLGFPLRTLWMIEAGGEQVFEVTMPEGRAVTGRVVDAETGDPVPDAIVAEHASFMRPVTTGPDGRYRLLGFTGWLSSRVHVAAEGYARRSAELPAKGDLDFALMRGFAAVGRVISADGSPIEGARLTADAEGDGATNLDTDLDIVSTESGPDGSFELSCLRTDLGPHVLTIRKAGKGTVRLQFESSDGGEASLGDILLPVGRAIAGTAYDPAGEPLPHVAVSYSAMEGRVEPGRETSRAWRNARGFALTGPDGGFRVGDLSPGRYVFDLRGPGEAGARLEVMLPADHDLDDVVLALPTPATQPSLTIRVVDTDGKPIAGARVSAGRSNRITGADGRAAFTGLTGPVHAQVMSPETAARRFFPAYEGPFETDGREVTVTLTEGAVVSGRVLGPEGVDLRRLIVTALEAGTWQRIRPVICDALGRFEMLLPVGTVADLVVDGSRLSEDFMRPEPWLAIEGEAKSIRAPANDIRITTAEVSPDRSLTVRVVDPEGEPLAGISIGFGRRGSPSGTSETPSGADGRIHLDGLRAGQLEIGVVWMPGLPAGLLPPAPVRVVPDGTEVLLRLERGVPVRGVALAPQGDPVPGCSVALFRGNFQLLIGRAEADAEGRFTLSWPAGVACAISASRRAPDGRLLQARLENVDPGPGEIVVTLTP